MTPLRTDIADQAQMGRQSATTPRWVQRAIMLAIPAVVARGRTAIGTSFGNDVTVIPLQEWHKFEVRAR